MMLDIKNNDFRFEGFLPNENLEIKCKTIYNLVDKHSPSSSTKMASLSKIGTTYEARLKVISGSCCFEISSINKEPDNSLDILYEKFTSKILSWNQQKDVLSCD